MSSSNIALQSTSELQRNSWNTHQRLFLWILLSIALAALLIRLHVGRQTFMFWDEWEHLFIASGARSTDVRFELHIDAHPPLYIMLLRGLLHLGHSKLLYRSLSILPGAGSVFLIGLICRKVCRYPVVALLCAGALAFSEAAISVGVEVRSYELTIFFVLLAFLFYLEILFRINASVNPRFYLYLVFSIATALAVACHYFAGLFLGACLIVTLLLALAGRKYRMGSVQYLLLSFLLPFGTLVYFYLKHARYQPMQGYLYDFYWGQTPHESRLTFLLRNLQNCWNLFSPVTIQSRPVFLAVAVVLCCAALYILYASWKSLRREEKLSSIILVLPAAILLELMALSLARKYPFGGLLRHQYILDPFLVLAVFVLLDRLAALLSPKLRIGAMALTGAAIAVNALLPRPNLIMYPGQMLFGREFSAYRAALPNARAVYLDRFGAIAYFSHTDDQKRYFVRSIPDAVLIDQYHITGGSPEGTEIFYDKTRGKLDLTDKTVYRSMASVLRHSGIKTLTLFYFEGKNLPLFAQSPETLKRIIMDDAAAQGMTATKIVIDGPNVYASFELTNQQA